MFEISEAAKPICIEPLYNSKFAFFINKKLFKIINSYALENNTVGIY